MSDHAGELTADTRRRQRQDHHYVGSIERIWFPGGVVETKRYIDGDVIVTRRSNGTTDTHYLFKDHLGSIDLITDTNGNVVQTMAFDPWGWRRAPTTFTVLTVSQLLGFDNSRTTRGFTGHEHADPVGLIHMNGRMCDLRIGRFISADPVVPSARNTQALNRYAYVYNNPMSNPPTESLVHRQALRNKRALDSVGDRDCASNRVTFERPVVDDWSVHIAAARHDESNVYGVPTDRPVHFAFSERSAVGAADRRAGLI